MSVLTLALSNEVEETPESIVLLKYFGSMSLRCRWLGTYVVEGDLRVVDTLLTSSFWRCQKKTCQGLQRWSSSTVVLCCARLEHCLNFVPDPYGQKWELHSMRSSRRGRPTFRTRSSHFTVLSDVALPHGAAILVSIFHVCALNKARPLPISFDKKRAKEMGKC